MTMLMNTVLFIVIAVFYFGFFAMLYLLHYRQRNLMAILMVLLIGVYGITASVGNEHWILVLPTNLISFFLPGAILIYGLNKKWNLAKIYFLCHVPLIIFSLIYYLSPTVFMQFQNGIIHGIDELAKSMGDNKEALKVMEQYKFEVKNNWSYWLFGILYGELSFRLIGGAILLAWMSRRVSRPILKFSSIFGHNYPNWPIWLVIGIFAGLLMSWNNPDLRLLWAGCFNIFLMVAPIYFLRGGKVLRNRYSQVKIEPLFTFFLILLTLMLLKYVILGVTLLGLLNTWFEFKRPEQTLSDGR